MTTQSYRGKAIATEENAIQCSARSNISHCLISKLEEGKIFSITNFSVMANKANIELEIVMSMLLNLKATLLSRSWIAWPMVFVRFPFQLIELEEIQANDSTYLIGVLGCDRCWNCEDHKVRVQAP